jgi:origin recognition complex subunit 6
VNGIILLHILNAQGAKDCRLKGSLNLPKIEPRLPCPQKVYKALYSYFDRTLVSGTRKRSRQSDIKAPDKALPQRYAPSKEISFQSFTTNRTPKKGLKYGSSKEQKLPRWVGPAIRFLHAGTPKGYENAVPHVFAGVETILFLPCEETADWDGKKTMKGKLPALIAAVLLYVMTGMSGQPPHQFAFVKARDKLFKYLIGLREEPEVVKKAGDDESNWEGWEEVTTEDIQNWTDEIADRGWMNMEWYKNVLDGTGANIMEGEDEGEDGSVEAESEEESVEKRKTMMMSESALGRMVQDKYDYLSENKLREYARWEKLMFVQIDKLIDGDVRDNTIDVDEVRGQ